MRITFDYGRISRRSTECILELLFASIYLFSFNFMTFCNTRCHTQYAFHGNFHFIFASVKSGYPSSKSTQKQGIQVATTDWNWRHQKMEKNAKYRLLLAPWKHFFFSGAFFHRAHFMHFIFVSCSTLSAKHATKILSTIMSAIKGVPVCNNKRKQRNGKTWNSFGCATVESGKVFPTNFNNENGFLFCSMETKTSFQPESSYSFPSTLCN